MFLWQCNHCSVLGEFDHSISVHSRKEKEKAFIFAVNFPFQIFFCPQNMQKQSHMFLKMKNILTFH